MNQPPLQRFNDRSTFDGPDSLLSYRRGGVGRPLILLHSLALGARMWDSVISEFLSDYEVFALDVRGHGESGWSGRDFSVEDLADDVLALLDHLSLSAASVLGLSMGGSIALSLAGRAPTRVSNLVCCDTTAWYGTDAPETWLERAAQVARRPRYQQISFQVDRWFTSSFIAHHPEVVANVTGLFLRCAPSAHAAACRALGMMDSRPLLGSIASPTLVLTGQDDFATPPAMGEAIAAGVTGAQMLIVPGKHFAILESQALRRQVLEHLGGTTVNVLSESSYYDPCCTRAVQSTGLAV